MFSYFQWAPWHIFSVEIVRTDSFLSIENDFKKLDENEVVLLTRIYKNTNNIQLEENKNNYGKFPELDNDCWWDIFTQQSSLGNLFVLKITSRLKTKMKRVDFEVAFIGVH